MAGREAYGQMMQIGGASKRDKMYKGRIVNGQKMLAQVIAGVTPFAIFIGMQQLFRCLAAKQPGNGLF